jgi:hypothetical protein
MTPATTPADIAAHKDTIALFTFAIESACGQPHTPVSVHGTAVVWSQIAISLADIGAATVGPEDRDGVRLSIGDAQTVWYVREGRFAIVVVLPKRSTLGKSVLRMCRRALRSLAAEETAERIGEQATAQVQHDTATQRAREATGW